MVLLCIHYHIVAKNIKALRAECDSMSTHERLRASFTSYSNALGQLVLLLKEAHFEKEQPRLMLVLAAQAHLNTILIRKILQKIAPVLMTPELIQQLEGLNGPPREICEVLHRAEAALASFRWEESNAILEDFALLTALSPTQNSMGAYFTPPILASQICRETIANWIWTLIPEVLRKQFSSDIQDTIARQNYLTGSRVEDFFAQLPKRCEESLKCKIISINLLKKLSLQFSKCQILDPACGSGIFLVEVAKLIFNVSQQFNSLIGGAGSNNDLARDLCCDNLFGIDLVPEYVRVARVLIFCTLLPHLKKDDVLPSITGLCQHIQSGNFLLSPFQDKLMDPVPPVLDSRILIEIATCFLDVIANNPAWKMGKSLDLEKYARGPIDAIPYSVWQKITMHLGILASYKKLKDLPEIILKQINPPLNLEKSYNIILGNPPQEGARKETGRQQPSSWTTRVQRLCIKYLKKSQVYADLQEAWDFSLPFIIRSMEVLAPQGTLAFILPRSIGTQTFARQTLTKIMPKIRRVAYLNLHSNAVFETWDPTRQELQPAGNDFLVLSCTNYSSDVPLYSVEELDPFDYQEPPSGGEIRQGEDIVRFLAQPPNMPKLQGIPLKFFVTITKGATLCAKAEWRRTRGSFKTRDLVSKTRDSDHPLRFVEPSHIAPFFIVGESFLEFHHAHYPDRVPANIHRWREDAFFHGPLLITPLSKRIPSFAIIPESFESGSWRSPETIVLFKRWSDWFREFPEELPPAIERMRKEAIGAFQQLVRSRGDTLLENRPKILGFLSENMPLEVLALILSSPRVHELRLKGGKSFGKYEAGDWENVPLPLLEEQEVATLRENYHVLTQTLEKLYKNVSRSGKSLKIFTGTLATILFKENESISNVDLKNIPNSSDFILIRDYLDRSFKIIEAAYNRNKDSSEILDSLLKRRNDL